MSYSGICLNPISQVVVQTADLKVFVVCFPKTYIFAVQTAEMNKILYPFNKTNEVIKCVIDTSKINPLTEEPYGYYIEADDYVSITRNSFDRKLIYSLPSASRDLFFMIPLCLNRNYPYVVLPKSKRDEIVGTECSVRTYNDGIKGLIQHGIIDFKDKKAGVYWINHGYFYFGTRKAMFPANYRVRKVLNVSLKNVVTDDEA